MFYRDITDMFTRGRVDIEPGEIVDVVYIGKYVGFVHGERVISVLGEDVDIVRRQSVEMLYLRKVLVLTIDQRWAPYSLKR